METNVLSIIRSMGNKAWEGTGFLRLETNQASRSAGNFSCARDASADESLVSIFLIIWLGIYVIQLQQINFNENISSTQIL